MILLHNKSIFFTTTFSGVIPLDINLEDLIIDDSFILPINSRYYHYLKQPINQIPEKRLSKDTEHICIKIDKNENIFLITKDELKVYQIELPKICSLIFDDFTLNSENIFFMNINNYKKEKYNISQIIEDIYKKTCYQEKHKISYIASIEDLANHNLSNIKEYKGIKPKLKIFTLKDIEII